MESMIEEVGTRKYKIGLIPAYYAQQFLSRTKDNGEDISDEDIVYLMSFVQVKTDSGWIKMEDAECIDANVEDWLVLDILIEKAYEANFGFLKEWRMWRVPNVDGFEGSEPKHLSSFIHSIMTNGYATLESLKTTISLKDAFEMQDSILTKAMSDYRYMKLKGLV